MRTVRHDVNGALYKMVTKWFIYNLLWKCSEKSVGLKYVFEINWFHLWRFVVKIRKNPKEKIMSWFSGDRVEQKVKVELCHFATPVFASSGPIRCHEGNIHQHCYGRGSRANLRCHISFLTDSLIQERKRDAPCLSAGKNHLRTFLTRQVYTFLFVHFLGQAFSYVDIVSFSLVPSSFAVSLCHRRRR